MNYQYSKSLFVQQQEQEAAFLNQFRSGDFTLEAPLVVKNPYLVNVLSALVMFQNPQKQDVHLFVQGKDEDTSFRHTYSGETEQFVPVLGLYLDATTRVTLSVGDAVKELDIAVETPAGEVSEIISLQQDPAYNPSDLMFFAPSLRELPHGTDKNGDKRWLSTLPLQWQMHPLKNGHYLVGTERVLIQPYHVSGMYEVDILGKVYNEYTLSGGYHHAFYEMDDNTFLVATSNPPGLTMEDLVIQMDRATGEIVKSWNLKDVLVPGQGRGFKHVDEDWFHNNAIWYDQDTHSITLSARHIDALVNLDFESGDLRWIIGDPETWPEEKLQYFFTPVGEGFEWPYAPHSVVHKDTNHVLCFDNGLARSKNPAKYRANRDNYSRGVCYEINTETMEIKQVWQYGKERGAEFFSSYISNVIPYDNGYLVHSGGIGYDNGDTWERPYVPCLLKDPNTLAMATTVEVIDGKVAYEIKQTGNYYRAHRMPLYTPGYCFTLEDGHQFGRLLPGIAETVPADAVDSGEMVPDSFDVAVFDEIDRVAVRVRVEMHSEAGFILAQGDTQYYYTIHTDVNPVARMLLSGKDMPDGYSNVFQNVTKADLIGDFEIKLLLKGTIYNTGITIKGEEN